MIGIKCIRLTRVMPRVAQLNLIVRRNRWHQP